MNPLNVDIRSARESSQSVDHSDPTGTVTIEEPIFLKVKKKKSKGTFRANEFGGKERGTRVIEGNIRVSDDYICHLIPLQLKAS